MTGRPPGYYLHHAPGAAVVLVPAAAAGFLFEAVQRRNLDGRTVDAETWAVCVALGHAAALHAAASALASAPEATDGPSAAQPTESWMDVIEAAEQLGVTPRAVRAAAAQKRLPATRTPGGWRVTADAVEQYRARRRAS